MLDTTNYIRQAYLNKLDGNVIYNGKVIKVYGQVPSVTTPDKYIIIGMINENSNNNNQQFESTADIDIDIFCEQYRNMDLSVVDAISSLVLNLIIPSTGISDIGDANFQIYPLSRVASRYLPIENGDLYIARKIITINNSVIQN